MNCTHRFTFAAGLAFAAIGCGEQHFRSETTWNADGSVERAIYQPIELTPDTTDQGWSTVRTVQQVESQSFVGAIRDLPAASGDDATYVAAWASFASVDALPESLRIPASDPKKAGVLERHCSQDDLGLVTEFRWSETLTDVVSLADMAVARREAASLATELIESALQDQTEAFDSSALLHWLGTDATNWFEESHLALVEAALRKDVGAAKLLPTMLADIAAKYGLVVRNAYGSLKASEEINATVGEFLIEKVRDTVKTREGRKLDVREATALLAQLGFTDPSKLSWDASPALEQAIHAKFGDDEAARVKIDELQTRLTGAYRFGLLSPRRPVHYELTMPGHIVESSGELIADQRILWRTDAIQAFPLGYPMTARSLVPNERAQKTLLGSVRIKSLAQLAEYASILRADEELLAVMQESAKTGSLKPLNDYEAALSSNADAEPVSLARIKALKGLLGAK